MPKVSFNDFENHIFIFNMFFLSSILSFIFYTTSFIYLEPHKHVKKIILNTDVECNFKH